LSEARLASLAKARGIPYSYIYHSPAEGCRRGTLLRWGKIPCDGEVRTWRCTACKMDDRLQIGMLGGQLAAAALVVAGLAAPSTGNTPLRRGLAVFYDSARYRKTFQRFLGQSDLVVSCCEWSRPVLLLNGAREEHLAHCPQGVSNTIADALVAQPKAAPPAETSHFVVGYVGRVTEVKGVHLLVEAFSRLAAPDARLRIVGWNSHYLETPYYQGLKQIADADPRIALVPMKPFAEMTQEYSGLALLAIPSVWRETGPLTLLEALALGVPVYGSGNIGQLDLLRQHGQIVEPNTADAWLAALTEAYARWQNGGRVVARKIVPPRTMADVATEMAANFRAMAAKRSPVAG
jgi:glycosyltransferase involved in cell wall biosynthesis